MNFHQKLTKLPERLSVTLLLYVFFQAFLNPRALESEFGDGSPDGERFDGGEEEPGVVPALCEPIREPFVLVFTRVLCPIREMCLCAKARVQVETRMSANVIML